MVKKIKKQLSKKNENTTKTQAKPATAPVTKNTSKSTKSSKSSSKPATKPASKSTAKPATKSAVKPATKSAVKPATPAETKTEVIVPSLADDFHSLLAQLVSLRTQLTAVTSATRVLAKRADREVRAATKAGRKRPRKPGNRSPSGFVVPTLISKELALFLQKPHGTEMARTQVTREINIYIREHKLQDPTNGRKIIADKKLRTLLKLTKEDELTYFNLQKYMSPHFAKRKPKTAPVSA